MMIDNDEKIWSRQGQCAVSCIELYVFYANHSKVSPKAARASEQPIATVCSALSWSTSFGLTSCSVSCGPAMMQTEAHHDVKCNQIARLCDRLGNVVSCMSADHPTRFD